MASASRRGVLAALAAAPVAAVPLQATARVSSRETVDRLWTTLLRLEAESLGLSRAHREAELRLPWWARSGPKYLVAEGQPERPEIGYAPARQDVERPDRPGAVRLIRPVPGDIESDYRRARVWGEEQARAVRDRQVAEYEARRAAALVEHERLGLPDIDAQQEAKSIEIIEVTNALEAMPGSLEAAAGVTLYWTIGMGIGTDTLDNDYGAFVGLTMLLPMIEGPVAHSVAEHLANRDRPFHASPLWGSVWAPEKLA